MVNGKLERREEAVDLALGYRLNYVNARKRQPWTPKKIDVWPWGACSLQDEACQVSVVRVLRFLRVGVWRVAKSAF